MFISEIVSVNACIKLFYNYSGLEGEGACRSNLDKYHPSKDIVCMFCLSSYCCCVCVREREEDRDEEAGMTLFTSVLCRCVFVQICVSELALEFVVWSVYTCSRNDSGSASKSGLPPWLLKNVWHLSPGAGLITKTPFDRKENSCWHICYHAFLCSITQMFRCY